MDILQNLTNLLSGASSQGRTASPQSAQQSGDMGGLGELLNPAVLGALAGALFPSNKTDGTTGAQNNAVTGGIGGMGDGLGGLLGSLLGSGALGGLGSLLGGNDSAAQPMGAQPQYSPPTQANQQERASRLLRALVYAAKADGHIDDQEQAALNSQVQKLNLGPEARNMLRQYMNEPLDPNNIARDVSDPQEATQLYALSCALTGMDNFMEKSYLDGLAQALRLPPSAKSAIENQVMRR